MRTCLYLLLIAVLASCRFWCASSACESHTTHAGAEDLTPHAINDDDCLCNGGLRPEPVGDLTRFQFSPTHSPPVNRFNIFQTKQLPASLAQQELANPLRHRVVRGLILRL